MHSLLEGQSLETEDLDLRNPVRPEIRPEDCPRCGGLTVREDFCDVKDSCNPLWIAGIRCANCGFIGDPLIHRHHRMEPVHDEFPQPRRRRGYRRLDPIRKSSLPIQSQEEN